MHSLFTRRIAGVTARNRLPVATCYRFHQRVLFNRMRETSTLCFFQYLMLSQGRQFPAAALMRKCYDSVTALNDIPVLISKVLTQGQKASLSLCLINNSRCCEIVWIMEI
jgi:hypothetical protein